MVSFPHLADCADLANSQQLEEPPCASASAESVQPTEPTRPSEPACKARVVHARQHWATRWLRPIQWGAAVMFVAWYAWWVAGSLTSGPVGVLKRFGWVVPVLAFGAAGHMRSRIIIGDLRRHRVRLERELQVLEDQVAADAADLRRGPLETARRTLHDVRNVLNSVNVSATILIDQLEGAREAKLLEAANELLRQGDQLQDFFARDARGQHFPRYLQQVASRLVEKNAGLKHEAVRLVRHVEHLKALTSISPDGSLQACTRQACAADEVMEDAWKMVAQPEIQCVRRYEACPTMFTDRHKVMQILVNLIKNAQEAVRRRDGSDKTVTLIIDTPEDGKVAFTVEDDGEGVSTENQRRLFELGFTTKPQGEGLGLYSCAVIALELGGTLTCHNGGPGSGARFSLTLPRYPTEKKTDHDLASAQ